MAADVPRRAVLRTANVEEAHARAEQLMTRDRRQVVRDDEPFAARIDTDEYDGLGVMHFSFGAEVLVESAPLEDFVTVHVPLSGRLRVEYRGTRTVADPRRAAVFSAHGPMTLGWERGLDLFVVKLDRAAVQQRLRDLTGTPPRGPLLFDVAADLDGDGRAVAGAVDLLRRTFAAAGPAGPSPLVRGELRHAVTTALLLGHPHSHTADVLAPQPPPPPRALRRALELSRTVPRSRARSWPARSASPSAPSTQPSAAGSASRPPRTGGRCGWTGYARSCSRAGRVRASGRSPNGTASSTRAASPRRTGRGSGSCPRPPSPRLDLKPGRACRVGP